ncbi:SWIM zinc finger family protein [Vibrio sp. SCSIO 43137]|uniref:SWIM zinc finger family protein n=1 Tax=Vibrio sp. SCSIO 43137 TaxID=3021011 RepID=UPI002307B9AD|nr:SWIM zinc finger family protein [Vibrio sp. SCSIO 43137]WCE30492.1 hypothetical protein PK654_04220 [Vibrio sp. SCSIO 43137]
MISNNEFFIQGSAKQPYKVVIESSETSVVKVTCDCQAGIFGKLCKHKVQILQEVISTESELSNCLNNSGYSSLVADYSLQEKELKQAKSKLDKTKKSLAKLMSGK